MSPTLRNETAELVIDVDGYPVLVRLLVKNVSAQMQSDLALEDAEIHSLLSRTLERMVDRVRGSSLGNDDALNQPLAAPGEEHSVRLPAPSNETVLRVGPLQLDLLDRTAKRGDRLIELKPREFQLLECMMRRRDQLLTRATLFKEVWHYKFVPETNLVDVYMGRLRRKVDGPDETPMIRNVRGAGFVLSATPSHSSRQNAAIRCSG